MEKEQKIKIVYQTPAIYKVIYFLFCVATAMVGHNIHHNAFYAVINFFCAPVSWLYWLITHNVNMTDITNTFSFFLQ
jgi:hypothetical protein